MEESESPKGRTWIAKFTDAFRGIAAGVRGQSSFGVHLFMTAVVLIVAAVLRVERADWIPLLLCITLVLCAELFNSALESLAKAIDVEANEWIGQALDIASGAVLIAAVGASVVGCVVFLPYLLP